MHLMIKSNEDNILNIFKPNIIFLDDVYLAEEESSVQLFLDDYGLTKEDIKDAGLKIMKNKITIPKGTSAEILDCKKSELTLRVKDIEFDCTLSFAGDFAYVDIEAIDEEKENFFSQYTANNIPKVNDKNKLYDLYISDIITAVNEAYNFDNRRLAFEELKYLSKERATSLTQRMYLKDVNQTLYKLGLTLELKGPFSSEEHEDFVNKTFIKKIILGKSKISPYIFYDRTKHSEEYNNFVNYCKDLPGLYFHNGYLSTINEDALKRFIVPYEKQYNCKIKYENVETDYINAPLFVVLDVN